MSSFNHAFVPDDEGLFCLFCGRTAGEHLKSDGDGEGQAFALSSSAAVGAVEEEDDWDAIQEELKRLTRKPLRAPHVPLSHDRLPICEKPFPLSTRRCISPQAAARWNPRPGKRPKW